MVIPQTLFIEPIRLQFRLIAAKFARSLALKRNDTSLFDLSCNTIDHMNQAMAKYTRDLLGLEAFYQLAGNAILLFYSMSDTKTSQGLAAMFQEQPWSACIFNVCFQVPSTIIIAVSFCWSLLSFTNSHLNV